MGKIILHNTQPMYKNVKNEPMSGVTFEQFWAVWDKLMDQGKIQDATIFLVQRYNARWNRGLDY